MDPNVFETANAGFAQALYEDFLRDPASVSPEWRQLFESGVVGERPPAPPAPAPGQPSPAASAASGDGAGGQILLKGPAARLAANMAESLTVPTATTFRELPVTVMDTRRRELNQALKAAGSTQKISFTHLIAWAIVQATRKHPSMGHSFAEVDGKPYRLEPEGISLGIAVDVTRKDGSRGLVVPVIKRADTMDFATFHATYESLIDKARNNKLMPDDFAGATMSLTNPGGLGTVASVPRLMMGQGSIIAVGAIGYPPEFSTATPETIRQLGIGKVMTVTSTYDHRVIQGAESGSFLATLDRLLQGEEGFYETVGLTDGRTGGQAGGREDGQAQMAAAATAEQSVSPTVRLSALEDVAAAMALVKAFRTHGHLAARLDPLGSEPSGDPSLDPGSLGLTPEIMASIPSSVLRIYVPGATLAESLPYLQATYCGTMAYEVEHISDHEARVWLREQIESGAFRQPLSADEQRRLLARLTQVESLEQFLHKSYLGQKRFSIEGVDLLVPMLDEALELAAQAGVREAVLGMAHRGRLNVLAHTVGRPYESIFAEFEGKHGDAEGEDTGTGDVKYHLGADGSYQTASGHQLAVSLTPNPSHLEFVGPVVEGRTRAKQTDRSGAEPQHNPGVAIPITIHGDAAFAGQGVVAETFNMSELAGYRTGGTLHIITNNQIGFTTGMNEARSTRHASDLAKGFDVPIIHVNADDPEACLSAVRLAMAYRERFGHDVLIDLVGYRRHGHNEGDEPAYTQPLMYTAIKSHPTVRALYAQRLTEAGVLQPGQADAEAEQAYELMVSRQQALRSEGAAAAVAPMARASGGQGEPVQTAVPADRLTALDQELVSWPADFTVNSKLRRQLERRKAALGPEGGIDWGHAEALAFASLLTEGVPLRLTGQDTERGTFSHRHLVLHDSKTGATYAPVRHLKEARAPFELHNSPLSELATLGFEYGYNTAAPEALVIWEAQFGDFFNGAQIIIDQFISAGLSKWGITSRLTLLLPHGFEGQGPEHSSARLERFLQLAAEDNLRVANCTTPAQYFHLLRRQALDPRQRPLVVMTPKSLLRLPAAASHLTDLSEGRFEPVLNDPWASSRAEQINRVVLCSGKVYYDLLSEAEKMTEHRPAIVRVEELYPFPAESVRRILAQYREADELFWVQEEPRNMGAWSYMEPRLRDLAAERRINLEYVGRPFRASPA
ncbi:MAG TPA: multifunctional oxoglutarate decarboxylase/oxoglutarate dehydrogenase thiamine pyrophosphate-binding subunit/dihydrolipoyllysine-residue succinyltransferase subunit, partial [Gemmatimonadales bacterium]|nr:multifunctional oxoglutarate decarboxylase/oxoglutarate dehydrogenase thiamine pyrophosphate-binding subunit/dihydrolipoyllysine-residue succinyltransferase subunit [Gemmatimonadales bacterium]